ncbi:MAG: AraC family transcriptional regulator ligand-binding domain-containing protein [Pseudomonadota bacterium]
MRGPYFATGYVRLLYRFARAEAARAALFAGTGCAESDLMRADFEMPFAAQMRLVGNALSAAAPGLGLRVGPQLQLAAHGALGTAMQAAPDLEQALSTFARFLPVRASFYALARTHRGPVARIEIATHHLPTELVPFFHEAILCSLKHGLSFFSGRTECIRQLTLAYPEPRYAAGYAPLFCAPTRFGGACTRLEFDRALLALPSPEADRELFDDSTRRCLQLLQRHQGTGAPDLVAALTTFLLENPGKIWTVREVAPTFAISPRTLIRRLKARGTSFQTLRDAVLKQQATRMLSSMGVEAAALSLGFADAASFRRTFKRLYGMTPSKYLEQQRPAP